MAEDKTEGEGPGEFDVEGSPPRFLECPSGEQKSSSSCIVEEIVPDKPSLQRGGCEQEENIPPTSLLCQPIIQGGKKKGLRKAKPHRDLLSPPRVAPSPPRKGGDKQIKGGKGEGGVRRGEGEQDRRREIGDLEALRVLAREFYVSVEDHFHSFEPGLCDDSQEFYKAFQTYIVPNLALKSNKRKMYFITRYLVIVTELLGLKMGAVEPVKQKFGRIVRVEEIDFEWVTTAERVWKSSQWVKVLHKMAQESNATLIVSEIEGFKEVIKEYLQYLKGTNDFLRKEILRKICYFLLEHLCTHSLDPCNLFFGSIPSEMAIERIFLPFNNKRMSDDSKIKNEHNGLLPPSKDFLQALIRWNSLKDYPDEVTREIDSLLSLLSPSVICRAGWYVAVNVSSLQQNRRWFWDQEIDAEGSYKYVLFRLAEPLLSSDSVAQIFLDCFETKRTDVHVEDLLYYHKGNSIISLEKEKNCKSGFFETPLFMYLKQMQEFIKKDVSNRIKANGAMHCLNYSTKLNYNTLEELCQEKMILEKLLAASSLVPDSVRSVVRLAMALSRRWASHAPPMLFPPPRLEDALNEILNFLDNLPLHIENEFHDYLSDILSTISSFKKRGADLKSGKLKNEMCSWWLDHIEKRVDKYLTEQGYIHNSLPDDYLRTPPTDMASVHKNHALLGEIIGEEGEKEGRFGVEKLVEEVVGEVYEKVDSLKEEMEFMLEKKWTGLPLEFGWEDVGEEGGAIMERDHEYLVEMKEMDEEIVKVRREGKMEKKELELSDVVPVAGLVMARFHVKNCEINTAIGHWQKMEEMAERKLREEEEKEMKEKKQREEKERKEEEKEGEAQGREKEGKRSHEGEGGVPGVEEAVGDGSGGNERKGK